jgi:hypothetical protein
MICQMITDFESQKRYCLHHPDPILHAGRQLPDHPIIHSKVVASDRPGDPVEGCSNREIAEKLVITEGTVKIHVPNILAKLQAENRTQAAMIARRYGPT